MPIRQGIVQGLETGIKSGINWWAVAGILVLTIEDHELETGWGPFSVQSQVVDDPEPLDTGTPYYVVVLDNDHFLLAASRAEALSEDSIVIEDEGTGPHQWISSSATMNPEPLVYTSEFTTDFNDSFVFPAVQTLNYNDGPFHLTTTGTLPDGLLEDTDYYVVGGVADTISIGLTRDGVHVTFNDDGTGTHTMTAQPGAEHYEPVPGGANFYTIETI